ncbi:MAG TPA: hypothetical protein VK645_13115 [Chitinophagaceae bacterium]|nr:hypothetical protein [Chitinophagaceae bacterium]
MKRLNKIVLVLLSSMVVSLQLAAQNAIAISSNPGPGLHTALNWQPAANAVRYNIYRKNDTDPTYPAAPLNALPVQPAASCFTIKSLLIVSADSTEWKMVARGLADSVLFNPCLMNTLSKTSEKYNRLLLMARGVMPIAVAAGLGYKDNTVVAGKGYHYRIDALDASNNVLSTVATDLHVTAAVFVPLPAPAGIVAEPGDAVIQVRWNDVSGAAGYTLERATSPAGFSQRVNPSLYSTRVKNHLNGDTLVPAVEGMLDFQRYDTVSGKAIAHKVNLSWINGPKNGITYYYRVRTIDFFNRSGAPSAVSNPALPKDSTNPSVPLDLVATPDNSTGHVDLKWTQSVKDINGHWEQPDSSVSYRVYRFTSSADPTSVTPVFLGEAGPLKGIRTKDTTDSWPGLRGMYGNKTWWYRLRAVDTSGNISQWSSAVSAVIKDITPPDIVHHVTATGFEDHIAVKWQLNTEPDMASYMVYRSLCHLGSWVECNPKDTCREWQSYDPDKKFKEKDGDFIYNPNTAVTGAATGEGKPLIPCPCSGPFVFLGEVTQDSAKKATTAGNFIFDDRTIPPGSPLCYAYWIKPKDSSDNLGGSFPLPSAAERLEIVCQRLHDLTPPEPALISGLFAQADQVRVEWMGPPAQDTRAYHVYRAEGTDPAKEPQPADYAWVGGMTIELPPTLPVVLTTPYKAPGLAPCDKISVQATPWMSQGFFEDKNTKPKLTYWYRVVGIDYDGNETPLQKAAAISTFTFTRKTPPAPILDALVKQADPCAVVLQWSPIFNAALHKGFIIYRSSTATGSFMPIVISPLKTNSFTDNGVVRGQTYWYRIGILMANGRLSDLSPAQAIIP